MLGVSFSGALIDDVLEDDRTVAAASEAWDRLGEFVERDPDMPGAFRFRHALIRDAAYEGLSYKRRRELHGRVAEVIERRHGKRPEEETELLSLHYYRAERWSETWRYSVVAGKRAEEKYANVEAKQFFERALEVASGSRDVGGGGGPGLGGAGRRADAHGEYERAADAYRASRKLSRAARRAGTPDAERGHRTAAARALPAGARRLTRRFEHWKTSRERRPRRSERGFSAGTRGCSCGSGARHGGRMVPAGNRGGGSIRRRDALAQADFILDMAYIPLGRKDEAVYSARAVEIYERLGDLDRLAWVLNNHGGRAYLDGRWNEALELSNARDRRSRGSATRRTQRWRSMNIAEVRSDQGRTDEAEPCSARSSTCGER